MMAQHDQYNALQAKLQASLSKAISFKGTLYRACEPEYANTRDLLSGEGNRKTGGRWNPPAQFAVTYLAQTLQGAIAESLGTAAHFGFDPSSRLPLTLVAVGASLQSVLDLTNPTLRKSFKTSITAMIKSDWRKQNDNGFETLTQALGRAAFEAGFEGIIVPSAVKRTFKNLNVFWSNLRRGSSLKVLGAQKLPPPFIIDAT